MTHASGTQRVVCFVIDHLQAGYLGTYGNTWFSTPQIDRLASESVVFDQAFLNSPHLQDFYHALQTGNPFAFSKQPNHTEKLLPTWLSEQGVQSCFLTDETKLREASPWADAWQNWIEVDLTASTAPAESWEETELSQFFAIATETLLEQDREAGDTPLLYGVHCGALGRCWDAPLADREAFLDDAEDEEELISDVFEAPSFHFAKDFDPEERLALQRAYAAQVRVLDSCLGYFVDTIQQLDQQRPTLFLFLSPRGYPLGEHQAVGMPAGLHEELIHLPCFLRLPAAEKALTRSDQFIQPHDFAATIAEALAPSEKHFLEKGINLLQALERPEYELRDRVYLQQAENEASLRTAGWYYHETRQNVEASVCDPQPTSLAGDITPPDRSDDPPIRELYVKPDDRWEVNDTLDRAHEEAEAMQELVLEHQAYLRGEGNSLRKLPEILRIEVF
ncbi:Hypothetical protein PBC10988_41130 [Planctomycetales bacterium 10988]|nr:Hypothetical protein PBC10988_41130 [Planctomycetales bacterium 10988]